MRTVVRSLKLLTGIAGVLFLGGMAAALIINDRIKKRGIFDYVNDDAIKPDEFKIGGELG